MWRLVMSANTPGKVMPVGCSYWRSAALTKMRVISGVSIPVTGVHFSTPPTRTTSWMPFSTAWTACLNAFVEVAQASSNRCAGMRPNPVCVATFGARWVSFSVIPPRVLPK